MSVNEKCWAWKQAVGSVLKVVSHPEKGTIEVFDQQGKQVMKKTGLTPEQVHLVEKMFLSHVAQLTSSKTPHSSSTFDPMIA